MQLLLFDNLSADSKCKGKKIQRNIWMLQSLTMYLLSRTASETCWICAMLAWNKWELGCLSLLACVAFYFCFVCLYSIVRVFGRLLFVCCYSKPVTSGKSAVSLYSKNTFHLIYVNIPSVEDVVPVDLFVPLLSIYKGTFRLCKGTFSLWYQFLF